ncbi:MAG TPA: phosphotransferase family protein [Acidimicrobiales bacterium]|nr:phosphotransferase family protein [Acidimicrobiales bacterium]
MPTPDRPATPLGIERDPVHRWFVEHVGDVGSADELRFDQVQGGHSCLTYIVHAADGTRYVLRRPPVGHLLASAHDVMREHRVITALAGTDVPVAPVVGACEDPEVTGAPFYVMAFVDGPVLHDRAAAERLPVAARQRAAESLIEVLVALRAVDPDAVGLGDFAKRTDYLGRQLRRWHGQWEAADTRPMPRMAELHDWLVANQPEEGPAGIVHGDFRLGNVIHAPDGSVAALLDWELCTLGPPAADLSYLLSWWADPGATTRADAASAADGFPDRAQLVAWYEERTGEAARDLDYWLAFHAWRSGCIAAGVYTRYKAGQMGDTSDDLVRFEDSVEHSIHVGLVAAGIA